MGSLRALGAGALAASLLLATPATAGKKLTIKVGSVAPEGTPWAKWLKMIARRMKKSAAKGGYEVKVKPFLGGRLGGEKEMVEECRLGRLPMIGVSTGAIATAVPALNVFELPFLFRSDAEADYIMDEVVFDKMGALLDRAGFVLIAVSENGWHGMATQGEPILKLADFKGRKLRVQRSRVHLETFKALGAAPVEMGVPEVLPALQNKVVDGFTNTPLFSFATNWYQAIQHYSVTRHIYQPAILVASKRWFNRLDPQMQMMIIDRHPRAEEAAKGRKWIRRLNAPLLEQFKANRVQVHHPSAEALAEMEAASKSVHKLFRKFGGPAGAQLLDAINAGLKEYRSR